MCPHLVEIGLTDLSKSGGGTCPRPPACDRSVIKVDQGQFLNRVYFSLSKTCGLIELDSKYLVIA